MRKLTGKNPFTQEAYNRMAEILNEQQQSDYTLWDMEVVG